MAPESNASNSNVSKKANPVPKLDKGFRGQDIISVSQFSRENLDYIFGVAERMRAIVKDQGSTDLLKGCVLACLFYEPSTRTSASFIAAMSRLGGSVIPITQGVQFSSVSKGESLPDTIRTLESYADVIVIRHPDIGSAQMAADYARIPIINGGDGVGEHPTQALLDLFTIKQELGRIDGLHIGMVGDLRYGRTVHSLARLLCLYDVEFDFVSPEILRLPLDVMNEVRRHELPVLETYDVADVISVVDVLYVTRVQKERFADLSQYEEVKNYYVITPELMEHAKKEMIVMHPLPRVGEISYAVDSDPRAAYFHQMENGMSIRLAQTGGKMGFFEKLASQVEQNDSLLCVGLDPDRSRFAHAMVGDADPILAFNKMIIDATSDLVCAYKPNFAFYEAEGLEGLQALRRTIDYVPAGIPVILDAKRGDIGSTAAAYARAAFEVWGADAVTVNPYLGYDALQPFADYKDRGVFLLCHTSNPGAGDFQSLLCNGRPLYETVAEKAAVWGLGLVVGATYPEALRTIRSLAPEAWILVPGVGAQGGDLEKALAAGLTAQRSGLIISASRSVIYADDPRSAAMELRDCISEARLKMRAAPREVKPGSLKEELVLALYDTGCVRFGEFTLVSGQPSPIYLDLRLLVSVPQLLRKVARAYTGLLRPLSFDRLAAIPYAALPIGTAVAMEIGAPLLYPRKELKEHGTRQPIEGRFEPGEKVVVLDDLITTAGSKLRAIAPLEEAGLVVEDVVVLVDREQGGKGELEARGYRLHSFVGLREMLQVLALRGRISPQQRDQVLAFLYGDAARD
jgi:aspartate carbamoyltransferase/orotidine 5'-phosphate decarboxylase subfamily 2